MVMASNLRNIEQPGLKWEEELFSCEPIWTTEPAIEIIKALAVRHLKLENEVPDVSFFAEVPTVFAHDDDLHSELGFEWILMERVEAQSLHEVWQEMSWLKKGLLVMQVADFMAQLFRIELFSIGSLRLSDPEQRGKESLNDAHNFVVGETVLPPFFKNDNIKLDISRGPFTSTQDYIHARIQLAQHFASRLDLTDEDDLEHYEDIQTVLSGIRTIAPHLMPASHEQTILSNREISSSNILVSPDGSLVSIVDWECVAFAPLFQAKQIPQLLKGQVLNDVPDHESSPDALYLERIEAYQKTRLREFFFEEMQRVEPRWLEVYESQQKQRDILIAIDFCENDLLVKRAKGWVGAVLEGREPKLSLGQ
ncbi:hypothetical protein HBI56_134730 [Parastagonospora nodorum]|nr:hypothetical protein HBH56_037830 [Parastagonospora nodorum]KAH3952521.1 hypothetical protein HBH53_048480 [Parastagonospora nodorum]KAH3980040.1 hypothetical protein HBH52_095630 [Parastagonospora nodorum]KAH4049743.1 hypothetical protein HBH49_136860 [Parastagonospora nodorum]KAH4098117.1 hypothetical protein HBH48_028680 [Parastagonospora nodorum]